jgi:hypothetical protein
MGVHVPRAITVALRLRSIDVLTAQEDSAAELDDGRLLERATELGRVLVSQDDDLLREGTQRSRDDIDFSGIIYAHQLRMTIGRMVEDLELIAHATLSRRVARKNRVPSHRMSVRDTKSMTPGQPTPKLQLTNTADYRENYANSVQARVSLWDFFLLFGTINQTAQDAVTIQNFQGIFMSPPQAKALFNILQQNIKQYESAFGEIRLEAHGQAESIQ